jgi:hypothetical protein
VRRNEVVDVVHRTDGGLRFTFGCLEHPRQRRRRRVLFLLDRDRAAEHLYGPVHHHVANAAFGDRTAGRHHRRKQAAGAEARSAVRGIDAQLDVDVRGGRVTQGRDAVDVGRGQPGVFDGGAHRLHGQLQARDAGAAADS